MYFSFSSFHTGIHGLIGQSSYSAFNVGVQLFTLGSFPYDSHSIFLLTYVHKNVEVAVFELRSQKLKPYC